MPLSADKAEAADVFIVLLSFIITCYYLLLLSFIITAALLKQLLLPFIFTKVLLLQLLMLLSLPQYCNSTCYSLYLYRSIVKAIVIAFILTAAVCFSLLLQPSHLLQDADQGCALGKCQNVLLGESP